MRNRIISRFAIVAATVSLLGTQAQAWSINGTVKSTRGVPLPDVRITSFNYASVGTITDMTGAFSLDENTQALTGTKIVKPGVSFENGILSIENLNANLLKVSLIDALGKVIYQRTLQQVHGNFSLDLNRLSARGAKFARIHTDGSNASYLLTQKAALLKEGDLLPVFMFSKDGYKNFTYQMKAENETNVLIQMEEGQNPDSGDEQSSSSLTAQSSSSAKSSSSKQQVVVDCSGKTYAAGNHNMTVNVGGKNRTFIMHVPSAYKGDKPVPLVVDYHPIGGSGQGQMDGTTYKAQTDPEGVISLYPDGTGGKSMMGAGWNVGPCCSNDDDVEFSRAMIKQVEETVCIDPKRVYATGFSMGGGMSNHVACFMSDVYAAVAPAAMDLNKTNSATCNPERPISIIMFRGTADYVCKYEGGDSGFNDGLNFLGAEGNFKFWANKNECSGSPTTNSNGCQEYSNCKDGTKVVLCTKQGGSHEQGDGSIGWPFLKSFTLP